MRDILAPCKYFIGAKMTVDDAEQTLLDQQTLIVLEFALRAEAKFGLTLPDDVLRLQDKLVSVPGYSISNPLEFYRLLTTCNQQDNPTMGEISEALSISLSTATRAVNFLEKNGWAERQSDTVDGRRIRVGLTDKGQEVLNSMGRYLIHCNREILRYLTPQERIILTTLLDKLTKCFAP